MIPLRDTIPRRTAPIFTTLLILVNIAFFFLELLQGSQFESFIGTFAFIPARFFHPSLFEGWTFGANVLTLFTAMFLHGGFLHLLGNMLFLWIFGDNVEDELGHFRFLFFYLLSGVSATLLQGVLSPDSRIPNLGASGAIAGVLGAYFVLFPRARIVTLVPLFFFFPLIEIPAWLYLLFWFVMQFWMGSASLSASAQNAAGGTAWWAHVGGFVAGLFLVGFMRPLRKPAPRYRIV